MDAETGAVERAGVHLAPRVRVGPVWVRVGPVWVRVGPVWVRVEV